MKLTELLVEDRQLTEKTKAANPFGSMVDQLTGKNKTPDNAEPAKNFSQGGYGKTTINAPTGITPPQKSPTAPPAPAAAQPATPDAATQAKIDAAPQGYDSETGKPNAVPAATPEQPAAEQPAAAPEQPAKPGLGQRIGQGARDFIKGVKQGYSGVDAAGDSGAAEPAGANNTASGTAPAAGATAPASSSYAQIKTKVDQLDKKGKQRILATLQKNLGITPAATKPPPAAQPAGSDYDPDKAAADKLSKGQADQQQAMQQMKSTADANAATAADRGNIERAGKAAAAKPGFQRTAADTLAIKAAKEQGIKVEAKKSNKKKKNLKESKGFHMPFSLFKK